MKILNHGGDLQVQEQECTVQSRKIVKYNPTTSKLKYKLIEDVKVQRISPYSPSCRWRKAKEIQALFVQCGSYRFIMTAEIFISFSTS